MKHSPLTSLEGDLPETQIDRFSDLYGKAHLWFLYHAAFPLSLTPDLLYCLRDYIQRKDHIQDFSIPWIVVSDVLLSGFCKEVGHGLYEFKPDMRHELLRRLKADDRFGEARLKELATFILIYTDSLLYSTESVDLSFVTTLRWGATAYLRPQMASRDFAAALSHSYEKDFSDLNRVATIVKYLADPLANSVLLDYACGMALYARGDETRAAKYFQKVSSESSYTHSIGGIHLSIPEGLETSTKSCSPLPPWLWLWLVTYFFNLPNHFTLLKQSWTTATVRSLPTGNIEEFFAILRLSSILHVIPLCALFLGVFLLLFPTTRAAYLEKKYLLKTSPASKGMIAEIVDFLSQQAPNLSVKINLRLYSNQYVFSYPLSFRTMGIAIFASLVRQWKVDRPLAEAVLMHEIAHYRQGDSFASGILSPFAALLNRFLCLSFLLPLVIAAIALVMSTSRELTALNQSGVDSSLMLLQIITHVSETVVFFFAAAVSATLSSWAWTLSVVIVPMVGLWCVELNADQVAAQHSRIDILRAISFLSPIHRSWQQWITAHMTSPTSCLRKWFLGKHRKRVLLLLLYPMSYLLRLIVLSGSAVFQGNFALAELWALGLKNTAPAWLVIALILALWPLCAGRWEWLVTRRKVITPQLKPMPYWVSAGIVFTLAIIGYSQSI